MKVLLIILLPFVIFELIGLNRSAARVRYRDTYFITWIGALLIYTSFYRQDFTYREWFIAATVGLILSALYAIYYLRTLKSRLQEHELLISQKYNIVFVILFSTALTISDKFFGKFPAINSNLLPETCMFFGFIAVIFISLIHFREEKRLGRPIVIKHIR